MLISILLKKIAKIHAKKVSRKWWKNRFSDCVQRFSAYNFFDMKFLNFFAGFKINIKFLFYNSYTKFLEKMFFCLIKHFLLIKSQMQMKHTQTKNIVYKCNFRISFCIHLQSGRLHFVAKCYHKYYRWRDSKILKLINSNNFPLRWILLASCLWWSLCQPA